MNKIVRYCERCGFRAEIYFQENEVRELHLEDLVERARRMFDAGHVCWSRARTMPPAVEEFLKEQGRSR